MRRLSKSTLLMNLLIGLGIPNPHYEPVFHKNGYQLEKIEPQFSNTKGETINPDLQYKSHSDKNLVFFECKLGAIEHEQALRYKNLTKEDIIQSNITSLDMSESDFEVIYFTDEASREKVLAGEKINNYGFAITFCGETHIQLGKNVIKGEKLQKIFSSPIPIPKAVPTEFYPFGPDDKKNYIAQAIFQSLLSMTGKGKVEITVEEILRESHPYYDSISTEGKKKLKEIVSKIMNALDQKEFVDVLKIMKNPTRFRINPTTHRKFRDTCLKKMAEYEKGASQKAIADF